jgi:uncharacterized protein
VESLRFQVTDLIGHPGLSREVAGELRLSLVVGETRVDDVAGVVAGLDSIPEGILVSGRTGTIAHHQCARCLVTWDAPVEVTFTELFTRISKADSPRNDWPRNFGPKNDWSVEDQYRVTSDGWIDLEPLVHDEIALALPSDPLCRPDCAGLCPICGADLNMGSCAGHGDESSSPFAALKQLFGSET